eukprot:3407657-Pyramimonas_sp.AAC.1
MRPARGRRDWQRIGRRRRGAFGEADASWSWCVVASMSYVRIWWHPGTGISAILYLSRLRTRPFD